MTSNSIYIKRLLRQVNGDSHQKIMSIIKDFKRYEKDNVLVKTFTDGYCYEFAYILWRNVPGSKIVFITNKDHYVLENSGRYYDITGEIKVDSSKVEEDDIGISK